MGWAEKRVEEYQHGANPTWLELRTLEHANPVHLVIRVLAGILFIAGLWIHNWPLIIIAIILALTGHVYCWRQ